MSSDITKKAIAIAVWFSFVRKSEPSVGSQITFLKPSTEIIQIDYKQTSIKFKIDNEDFTATFLNSTLYLQNSSGQYIVDFSLERDVVWAANDLLTRTAHNLEYSGNFDLFSVSFRETKDEYDIRPY